MAEDRLERIENKLDGLVQDVGTLKTDVGTLKTDVGTLKTDVGTLKTDVGTLKADVGTLKVDVGTLKVDVSALTVGQVELRRHMEVLHEEVLDRIKAVTLDPQAIYDKIERGDNAVRAELNERIGLIESAIRPNKR